MYLLKTALSMEILMSQHLGLPNVTFPRDGLLSNMLQQIATIAPTAIKNLHNSCTKYSCSVSKRRICPRDCGGQQACAHVCEVKLLITDRFKHGAKVRGWRAAKIKRGIQSARKHTLKPLTSLLHVWSLISYCFAPQKSLVWQEPFRIRLSGNSVK